MEIVRETYTTFPENAAFLKKIFPQDDEKYYYNFLNNDPLFSPSNIYSIKNKNQTIATLWFLPRLFLEKERMVLSAGIANVATDPAFRGQGLASQLVEKALKEAEAQNVEFLILVTAIPAYYQRWGFQEIGKYEMIIEPSSTGKYQITYQNIPYENILDTYKLFYQGFQMKVPFRNLVYMKGMEKWNQWSAMFNYKGKKADWFLLKDEASRSLIFYGLDKGEYFKVFEILWDENIKKEELVSLLHNWAYYLKKNIHIDLAHPIIDYLGLKAEKDSKNTIMIKPYWDIDLKWVYLHAPDYF